MNKSTIALLLGGLVGVTWSGFTLAATDAGTPDAAIPTDAGETDAGNTGATHSDAGSDGGVLPRHVVGLDCAKDVDCAPGLKCLLPSGNDLGTGGPAGGLCSRACTAHGQADCDAIDTGSVCLNDHCFERCDQGVPGFGVEKCHSRADVACARSEASGDYCAPTCGNDKDCGSRKCDPLSGLCVDTVAGTLSQGAACDPSTATDECRGRCLYTKVGTSGPETSFCSAFCTLGVPGGCGQDPASLTPTAACFVTLNGAEAKGDIGLCAELCDCDSDCTNPAFVCQPFAQSLGISRAGSCVPSASNAVHLTCALPDAGSGGAGGGGAGAATTKDGGETGPNTDGGAVSPGKPAKASGGCGCHAVNADSDSNRQGLVALTLALGLTIRRRRRVRS